MTKRFYNFGGFRLDTHNQRLLRDEETIKLTLKQFELLLALIENAGDVVSKDQLFRTVWKDVAVADETLTRNISWLRQKLGDGGFIETVPKRGYRFAAEITTSDQPEFIVEETTLTRVLVEETIDAPKGAFPTAIRRYEKEISGDLTTKRETTLAEKPASSLPPRRRFVSSPAFVLTAVLALASIGFVVYQNYFARAIEADLSIAKVKPLSGAQGRENTPAFSPDSKQIAFSWNGNNRENSDIYVQIIGAGEPVRLTDTEAHEQYPVFSPDGTHIAFVRDLKTHGEIILIPALGGAERRLASVFSGSYSISFAPDGNSIAAVDRADESGKHFAIYAIDLKTGARRRLTARAEFSGETTPRFAPDGKSLAFVGLFPDRAQDLYVVSTTGENNEPRRLTADRRTIHSLAWSADGKEIFFVSLRESNRANIWRIDSAGGSPQLLLNGGKETTNLAASPDGKLIAFVENTIHSDIYSLAIGEALVKPLIATSFVEDLPDFAPDGRHIVFRSNRSGGSEAWMSGADGKNLRQITDSGLDVGNVRFSPDAAQIAFHARNGENKGIYVASVESGAPRLLTQDGANNSFPAWSADGKFIFYSSDRTGERQLWRIPAEGGEAVQMTRTGALEPAAAADGKWVYYIKDSLDAGLWRVSANAAAENSDEAPVRGLIEEGFQNVWTLRSNGVYFIARADKPPAKIKFYDFSTGRAREVAESDKIALSKHAGLTVSPDGKTILFAQFDQNAGSVMLAELNK